MKQNCDLIEILRDGDEEYGILVDPTDSVNIAQGLERLLSDAQTWEKFAHCGQQHVLNHYTWGSTAENYLTLIEQIVSSPSANRSAELLPIHPYFRNPQPESDVSLQELSDLYFSSDRTSFKSASL